MIRRYRAGAAHRRTSLMVGGRTVNTAASSSVRVAVGDLNGNGKDGSATFRET